MDCTFSNFIGIDVSKDTLDIFSTETKKHVKISNSDKAIQKAFLAFKPENSLVILENTGGYERLAIAVLLKLGFKIHRANNNLIKSHIDSLGKKAKTDKFDSIGIADYGEKNHKKLSLYVPLTEKQKELKELSLYRESLSQILVKEKNRFQSPGCSSVIKHIKKTIENLEESIRKVDIAMEELINSDEDTKNKLKLLMSYKGIGKTTAMKLLSAIPELGTLERNKIAALAGLAPYTKQSGNVDGYRTTKGSGRQFVKRGLFLAALSAIRYNDELRRYYNSLIHRSHFPKKPMQAVVACMRKMIVHLNAILRDGQNNFLLTNESKEAA